MLLAVAENDDHRCCSITRDYMDWHNRAGTAKGKSRPKTVTMCFFSVPTTDAIFNGCRCVAMQPYMVPFFFWGTKPLPLSRGSCQGIDSINFQARAVLLSFELESGRSRAPPEHYQSPCFSPKKGIRDNIDAIPMSRTLCMFPSLRQCADEPATSWVRILAGGAYVLRSPATRWENLADTVVGRCFLPL